MTQSRTHTCNELRMEHVGQKVKIVGWMENVREVGQNFAFVVVRDFYGTTQVVVETEDMEEECLADHEYPYKCTRLDQCIAMKVIAYIIGDD